MMKKIKLGGWQRIYIILSAIYLIAIVIYAIREIPQQIGLLPHDARLEIIELSFDAHKEKYIKELMKRLAKYLEDKRGKNPNPTFGGYSFGNIYVKSFNNRPWIKTRHFVLEFYKSSSSEYGRPILSHHGIFNNKPPLKILTYNWDENPRDVAKKAEETFRSLSLEFYPSDILQILYPLNTEHQIYSKLPNEYKAKINFASIEAKYKKEKFNLIVKLVITCFLLWILPVVAIYLLFCIIIISIKWVIKGFRESKI